MALTDSLSLDGASGHGQLLSQLTQSEVTMPFAQIRLGEIVNGQILQEQEEKIASLLDELASSKLKNAQGENKT
jgi:hypothetical protein